MLEQHLRAAELRSPEIVRGQDRTIDVCLRCEVDDRLATAGGPRDVSRNRDVALMELDVVGQVRTVARISELVEHCHAGRGGAGEPAAEQRPDEVRTDEPGAAGDKDPHSVGSLRDRRNRPLSAGRPATGTRTGMQ